MLLCRKQHRSTNPSTPIHQRPYPTTQRYNSRDSYAIARHEQNKDRAEEAMQSSNASKLFKRSIQLLPLCAAFATTSAQDTFGVHAQLAGHVYRDDKIEVEAPTNWTISIETETTGGSQQLTFA